MPVRYGATGSIVHFSTLITRVWNNAHILITFHPGHPVLTGRFHVEHLLGQSITVAEAKKVGFKHALLNERVLEVITLPHAA